MEYTKKYITTPKDNQTTAEFSRKNITAEYIRKEQTEKETVKTQ